MNINMNECALKNHDTNSVEHKPFIERSYSHADVASPTTVVLADGDYYPNTLIKDGLKSTFATKNDVEKPFYDPSLFSREDFPPDDNARFGRE